MRRIGKDFRLHIYLGGSSQVVKLVTDALILLDCEMWKHDGV